MFFFFAGLLICFFSLSIYLSLVFCFLSIGKYFKSVSPLHQNWHWLISCEKGKHINIMGICEDIAPVDIKPGGFNARIAVID